MVAYTRWDEILIFKVAKVKCRKIRINDNALNVFQGMARVDIVN